MRQLAPPYRTAEAVHSEGGCRNVTTLRVSLIVRVSVGWQRQADMADCGRTAPADARKAWAIRRPMAAATGGGNALPTWR